MSVIFYSANELATIAMRAAAIDSENGNNDHGTALAEHVDTLAKYSRANADAKGHKDGEYPVAWTHEDIHDALPTKYSAGEARRLAALLHYNVISNDGKIHADIDTLSDLCALLSVFVDV